MDGGELCTTDLEADKYGVISAPCISHQATIGNTISVLDAIKVNDSDSDDR
jgi:hypothetical protein